MTKNLLVAAAVACITASAFAGDVGVVRAIDGALNSRTYVGVTGQGGYCRIEVAKVAHYGGEEIYMTGYDDLPGTGLQRASGFFQIGTGNAFRVDAANQFANQLQVTVTALNLTPVQGIADWQGTLTLTANENNQIISIGMDETIYDPISNATSTRSFICGANVPN